MGVQQIYAPKSICFGCGPANKQGLQIASEAAEDDDFIAKFTPQPHHAAFVGTLNGGIIGTLLDCHGNWTAAMALMAAAGVDMPPCTVTAEFAIRLLKPTPMKPLTVRARAVETGGTRCVVEGELIPDGAEKPTATLRGVFVSVEDGHPAFHRW